MTTFHAIFQKSFIFLFTLCFMFVAVYVPHQQNQINHAEATLPVIDYAHIAETVIDIGFSAATYAKEVLIAAYAYADDYKEYVLDALIWAASKGLLAAITSSIVNWINSGFKGSPMFVQDFRRFMLHAADHIAGDFLMELGGLASFVCSPFQLDIQIALATSYRTARSGGYGRCTLTGALANIDNFVKGAGNFNASGVGGWRSWYSVTSRPHRYTTYGNLLAAQAEVGIRIRNAQGQEIKLLDFGGGFMSSKLCNNISIAGVTKEQCSVSTPGRVIEQALNFQLSSGSRSLIVADEIDEILGALMGQLLQRVVTGAAGLLGSSNRNGNSSGFIDRIESDHIDATTHTQNRTQNDQRQRATDAEAEAAAGDTTVRGSTNSATNLVGSGAGGTTGANTAATLAGASTNGSVATIDNIGILLNDQIKFEIAYSALLDDPITSLNLINTPASLAEATRLTQLKSDISDIITGLVSGQNDLNNSVTSRTETVILFNGATVLHTTDDVAVTINAWQSTWGPIVNVQ
jgi:hypothetical protein